MALAQRSKVLIGFSLSLAISAGLGITAASSWIWQRASEPKEIQTLRAVLERLSRHNDLGHRPINFMVVAGPYAAAAAEERGFCKPENCDFYAHLNPYREYNHGWNELMRQAYAFGDIQAWPSTERLPSHKPPSVPMAINTTTWFTWPTRYHFQKDHVFRESYHNHHNLKDRDEKVKIELMRFRQQQELEADRDAAEMVARAGFLVGFVK